MSSKSTKNVKSYDKMKFVTHVTKDKNIVLNYYSKKPKIPTEAPKKYQKLSKIKSQKSKLS